MHDQWVQVAYEFTSPEESLRFQGNLRRKTLVGFYDVDVVWTDVHRRLDAFGKVKGIGAIQRMKMWQDQCTNAYTLSVMANKTDRQYREYAVNLFDSEPRNKEERHKSLKLSVLGRRRSAPDQGSGRRISFPGRRRPRVPSTGSSPSQTPSDIDYLAIQFTSDHGKCPMTQSHGSRG